MSKKQTLCVDFDGVIHKYSKGWQDGTIYDEPVEGAIAALRKLSEKFDIVILTTRATAGHECTWRAPHGGPVFEGAEAVERWILYYSYPPFDFTVTGTKVPAIAYIDDRAVRFTNWADIRKLWL